MTEEYIEDIAIILEDEEGNEHRFEVYGSVDVEGQMYAILTPEGALETTEDGDELEVVIARIDEDDDPDSITFEIVDDEAEFQAVLDAWELADDEGIPGDEE